MNGKHKDPETPGTTSYNCRYEVNMTKKCTCSNQNKGPALFWLGFFWVLAVTMLVQERAVRHCTMTEFQQRGQGAAADPPAVVQQPHRDWSHLLDPESTKPQHLQIVTALFKEVEQLMLSQNSATASSNKLRQEVKSMKERIFKALDEEASDSPKTKQLDGANAVAKSTAVAVPSSSSSISSSSSSLLSLWKELVAESSPPKSQHRIVANVVPRRGENQKDDITMLTHVSPNKMDRLPLLQKFWGGPMSVAIWIKSEADVDDFYKFIELSNTDHPALRQAASYHVYMEYPPEKLYPHNTLRNLALTNMDSDYFLTNDADIVTNPNAYAQLKELMNTASGAPSSSTGALNLKEQLHRRSLFVLPVFERFLPEGKVEVTEEMLPTSKSDLMEMHRAQKLEIFYKSLKNIQGSTNYDLWFANSTDIYYDITYHQGFEPYVLGYKHGTPRYCEVFRGFGFNKQSWLMEAAAAKFKFFVLRDQFMVHRNHLSIRKPGPEKRRNQKHLEAFELYLNNFYNNGESKKKRKSSTHV